MVITLWMVLSLEKCGKIIMEKRSFSRRLYGRIGEIPHGRQWPDLGLKG